MMAIGRNGDGDVFSPIFACVDWVDILGPFLHKLLVAQVS
jgi:hypothetical protein